MLHPQQPPGTRWTIVMTCALVVATLLGWVSLAHAIDSTDTITTVVGTGGDGSTGDGGPAPDSQDHSHRRLSFAAHGSA